MNFYTKFILFLIIMIGFILRVYNLSTNPSELFHDEIINYVSAKSIVETGHDLDGKLLPYFSDRVEFRPPIYGYSSLISVKFLGEGVFAIRFPAVIFGLGAIIVLFFLVLEFTKNQIAALYSAFALAIIPWHIHYSRVGWEPAPVLLLLLSGLLLVIRGFNNKKPFLIYLGTAIFGFTIYTYHGAPLFSLLFLSVIFIIHNTFFNQNRKIIYISTAIYLVISLPFIMFILDEPTFFDRANSIFTFSTGVNKESLFIFFRNYLSHYSLDFLFLKGDPNLRHGAQTGVLYLWMLPFIFTGLYFILLINKTAHFKTLILLWLLIFPLGASLTNDGVPHAHRTLIGAPLFCILTGVGVWYSFSKLYQASKSKLLITVLIICLLFISGYSLYKFSDKYFNEYPKLSQHWWYYGHKDVFAQVKKLEKNYQRVCLGHLNYWETKPVIYYYLRDSNLKVIEGIDDKVCNQAGSILTLKVNDKIPIGGSLRATIYDLNQFPLYHIITID